MDANAILWTMCICVVKVDFSIYIVCIDASMEVWVQLIVIFVKNVQNMGVYYKK